MGKYIYFAVNTFLINCPREIEVRETLNFYLLINSTITICFVLFIGQMFDPLVGNIPTRAPGGSMVETWRHGGKKKIGNNSQRTRSGAGSSKVRDKSEKCGTVKQLSNFKT